MEYPYLLCPFSLPIDELGHCLESHSVCSHKRQTNTDLPSPLLPPKTKLHSGLYVLPRAVPLKPLNCCCCLFCFLVTQSIRGLLQASFPYKASPGHWHSSFCNQYSVWGRESLLRYEDKNAVHSICTLRSGFPHFFTVRTDLNLIR